jgi:hypothetical protein
MLICIYYTTSAVVVNTLNILKKCNIIYFHVDRYACTKQHPGKRKRHSFSLFLYVLIYGLFIKRTHNSSVGVGTMVRNGGPGNFGSIVSPSKKILSSSRHSVRRWGPFSLLSSRYWNSFPWR